MAGPVFASAQTFRDHESFDPAGAVFTCTSGDLTVLDGGTVTTTVEGNQDATGVFHMTGTLTVKNITAEDAAGNLYTINGASWFGGKATDPYGNDVILATDTANFVIHNSTGGVYAKVQAVEHLSQGRMFSFDFGSCEEPSN